MKKALWPLAATLMLSVVGAQTRPGAKSEVTVTGRVFAITKGGDVKPALLAHVYLYAPKSSNDDFVVKMLSAHAELRRKMAASTAKFAADIADSPDAETLTASQNRQTVSDIEDHCRHLVATVDQQLNFDNSLFPKPVVKNGTSGGAYATSTDEAGAFSVRVKPGNYVILVVGQAGSNTVLWMDKVAATRSTDVKLHSVVEACPR